MSVKLSAVTGAMFVVIASVALVAGRQAAPPAGSVSTGQLKQIAYL